MPRVVLLFLSLVLLVALPAYAQDETPPDYRISVISSEPSDDGSEIIVRFGVYNIGGPATQEATVILTVATTGVQLGIETIPPLEAQDTAVAEFSFPADTFPAGSVQSLQASVGIDEIELRTAPTIGNNTARIGITIPPRGSAGAAASTAEATAAPETGADTTEGANGAETAGGLPRFTVPLVNVDVNLNNPLHIGILIAILGILLVLLWVATVILRLLFQKTPTLNTWQPPYANMPMLDPNSLAGRRQLWQPHAQNDAINVPCIEGNYHIRKLLLGMNGATLSGWHITDVRISQYDMYGRVARSQTLAPKGTTRRLDRLARKAASADADRVNRSARSVANGIASAFLKKVNKRNLMLPIAMDVRLRGVHGEVRILFELYGCINGGWQLVDQWEPEMTVLSGGIHENFTYTMHGQRPGESFPVFRQRVRDELTRVIAEMVTRRQAVSVAPPAQPAATQTQQVRVPPPQEPAYDISQDQDTAPHPPVA